MSDNKLNSENTEFSEFDSIHIDDDCLTESVLEDIKEKTIYCISDIHLEFYDDMNILYDKFKNLPNATYLVLAGDIGNPLTDRDKYIQLLRYFKNKYKRIVLVAGNHEYYGCNKNRSIVIPELKKICDETGVILLDKSNVVIDGVRFIGATLWSLIEKNAFDMLNDSRFVFDHVVDYVEMFIDDFRYIKNELLNNLDNDEPIVVVTHHLPTKSLIHSRFKNHPANTGFSTSLMELFILKNVKYWFCGHTHEYCETKYSDTKLLVNPVGYPHETKFTSVKLDVHKI